MVNIDLTWNLFITAVLVPLSAVYITNHINKKEKNREQREGEMARLLAEKESLKEKEISEWRDRNQKTICDIKVKLEDIVKSEITKVTEEECEKKTEKEWKMINHHHHTNDGKVVIE